jgi:hypothetical protein
VFPRDVVCLRNISVDNLHKGDTDDDDDYDDNNSNNKCSHYDVKATRSKEGKF